MDNLLKHADPGEVCYRVLTELLKDQPDVDFVKGVLRRYPMVLQDLKEVFRSAPNLLADDITKMHPEYLEEELTSLHCRVIDLARSIDCFKKNFPEIFGDDIDCGLEAARAALKGLILKDGEMDTVRAKLANMDATEDELKMVMLHNKKGHM